MSNSSLVTHTKLSPNHSGARTHKIDTVTIHCVVGQFSAEEIADVFEPRERKASCTYGVGNDGGIALVVDEGNRSWCTSSNSNDQRAVTIEVASDTTSPYAVTDKAYNALINLLADICKRNGISELKWQANKSLIGQVDKQNMTVHRWFANKECPGDYLYSRHGAIADAVNKQLGKTTNYSSYDSPVGSASSAPTSSSSSPSSSSTMYYWPVPSTTTIRSKFGPRLHPIDGVVKDHTGIDIANASNVDIVAMSSGTVIKAGDTGGGYGKEIQIDHGNGLISQYAHNSELLVTLNQKVSAGQKIALMGTTGKSTGIHLHFGIKLNGKWVDPEKYVSPDGPQAGPSSGPISSAVATATPVNTFDPAALTVGQRVSGVTPQPMTAYAQIYIGSNLIPLATDPPKPNTLQYFEYHRLRDGVGEKATFSLFDNNWEEIEEVLSKNADRVWIEYGYYGTGVKSNLVLHLLSRYSISFNSTGSLLSVESITQGVVDNLKPKSIVLETFNPTEAVKKICTTLGYEVKEENFDKSNDIHADNPFNMIEEHPLTYINQVIIPQAAQEGEELFRFYVENNVAYFKRYSYIPRTKDARTYIYQKGYDSNVISLEFNINGIYGGAGELEIATGYKSTLFDANTKTQEIAYADNSTILTEATGDVTHTATGQSIVGIDSAGYTSSQAQSKLYYYMKHKLLDGYECIMTIVGDPTIILLEGIRLINITDNGTLHHTSGIYTVTEIVDVVEGGNMTTKLTLQRNATYNIDGVEILNPKVMIK